MSYWGGYQTASLMKLEELTELRMTSQENHTLPWSKSIVFFKNKNIKRCFYKVFYYDLKFSELKCYH